LLANVETMRQLFPAAVEAVDVSSVYANDGRPTPPGRPWVVTNMVTSIDGATVVDGVSGSLGGPADKEVFAALRAMADVVLVAAGTVRAERYGPPRLPDALVSARVARGQAAVPRLAIVTARLDLDLGAALFTDAVVPPLILTVEQADAARRQAASAVAEVVVLGDASVDLVGALGWLRAEQGASVVLSEGGPSLLGALAAADVIDVVCWTISNKVVAGDSPRMAHGAGADPPRAMHLARVLESDGMLFMRYVRADH
jgi:5-amino-6-(5-phosphoribosylamino)uracil reductase